MFAGMKAKIVIGLLLLLVCGIAYEQLAERLDQKAFPAPGRCVTVNGHTIHAYTAGKGDITVVFTAGWKIPSPYVDLYPLHHEIAKYTRIVVYDRPGYGWSETTHLPRDIDDIATEIHTTLEALGEKPPYLLVAHSIGSLEALRFAQIYKDEVKGIVLIDGSNPEMYAVIKQPSLLSRLRFSLSNFLIYSSNKTGLSRLLFKFIPGFYMGTPLGFARNRLENAPQNFPEIDTALFLKTFNNTNQVDEGDNKVQNCSTVAAHGYLDHIPLTVFTSEQLYSCSDIWESQLNLEKWSQNVNHILVPGAGHAIYWTHPDVINDAIRNVLKQNGS